MSILRNSALAGAVVVGMAQAAAATTTFGFDGTNSTLTFDWVSTPYSEEISFTVPSFPAGTFDLLLGDYSGVGGQQTGFYVDLDGIRLTNNTGACNSAAWANAGACNLVVASEADGSVLLSGLTAGVYSFGVYDSATPVSGSLTFVFDNVSSVPVPAAGGLLLGALGLLGLRRRRKSA
tara:strand:+ start:339 stop:872 length:534 start_codon:yes stop_codon:yes gene_type:complete